MGFLIAIAAAAVLIWTLVVYRRLNLAWGLGLVLLAGSVLGHSFYHRAVGPVPMTLDRVMWGILGLHLAIGLVLGRVRPIRFTLTEFLLASFLAVIAFNLAITNFRYDSMQPVSVFLFFLIMPAGCYVVARQAQFGPEEFHWMRRISIGFGLYLALTAFAESRGWSFAVFPRYINNPEFGEFLGRGRGPFLNPVVNGVVMIGCMIAGLTLWRDCKKNGRLLLSLYTAVMLLGCYATLTRTVWIAAAFALGLAVFLHVPRERRVAVLAGVALLAGLILGGAWDQLKAFKRDKDVTVEQMAQSASLRPLLATVAGRMIVERPILGHGFGQYRDNCVPYHFGGNGTAPVQMVLPYVQHNVILSLLVDVGIVGAGLFLCLLWRFSWEAWQVCTSQCRPPWQRAIGLMMLVGVASYLINGMFHDVLIIPMLNMFFFSLAGLVTNLRTASKQESTIHRDEAITLPQSHAPSAIPLLPHRTA